MAKQTVADTLSRTSITLIIIETLSYENIAEKQKKDYSFVRRERYFIATWKHTHSFRTFDFLSAMKKCCPRHFIPLSLRKKIFNPLHGLSHLGNHNINNKLFCLGKHVHSNKSFHTMHSVSKTSGNIQNYPLLSCRDLVANLLICNS